MMMMMKWKFLYSIFLSFLQHNNNTRRAQQLKEMEIKHIQLYTTQPAERRRYLSEEMS